MIRCVRAKSSMGYPEVFHRFCGYLEPRKFFLKIFSGNESRALSRSRRLNFRRLTKKLWSPPTTPVMCAVGRASARLLSPLWVRFQPDSCFLLRAPRSHENSRRKCRRARASAAGFPAKSLHGLPNLAKLRAISWGALESPPVGPVAQWLVQGTHRRAVPSRRKPRSGRDEFREPFRSRDRWQP